MTHRDAVDAYRTATGRPPLFTDSGKSEIITIRYTIMLEDESSTPKDIELNEDHEIGARIFDTDSGKYGKVLRRERVLRRTVLGT